MYVAVRSALWWLTLSGAVSPALLRGINWASGLVLFAFGLLALSALL